MSLSLPLFLTVSVIYHNLQLSYGSVLGPLYLGIIFQKLSGLTDSTKPNLQDSPWKCLLIIKLRTSRVQHMAPSMAIVGNMDMLNN